MEEITKMHVDWKKITVVGALIVLTGLTVGGLTWYVAGSGSDAELDAKDQTISDLETRISQLEADVAPTEETKDVTADWKTYTNSTFGVSFKYPASYSVTDKTSTQIGSDKNQYPWYLRSDFVKLSLYLKGEDVHAKLVLNEGDVQKLIGAMGGGGTISKESTVNNKKLYYVTSYGQSPESTDSEYVLVGDKYALVILLTNNSEKETIEKLLTTVNID